MSIDIFMYKDPSLFLRDHWLQKKKKNPSFSIRSWAKTLGISSHSQLHQMIYGKRAIPKKYLAKICTQLNLSLEETEYLETLINIQKSKTEEEKSFYNKKIISKRKNLKFVFHEVEQFELVKDPIHFFILEIFLLKGKEFSLERIKKLLQFDYTIPEIKRAIDTLINLNLIIKLSDNSYTKVPNSIFTQQDVPKLAIREYHKNLADFAKKALDTQSVSEREFNAVTFNIRNEDMKEAKEMIREFRERFVDKFIATESTGDRTYHLNINFFAVTKDIQ